MGLYEVLKAAKIGAASDVFTTLRGQQAPFAKGSGTEHEYTGSVPFTFNANGTPLMDWYIKGNTQQSGTPSPALPVDVVGVGTLDGGAYKTSITCNGSTTIIDLGSVQTIRKVKKKIITGSQVVGYSASANYITVKTEVPELKYPENRADYLCTHFQVATTAAEGKVVNRYANFYNVEFYLSTTFASLDEVKAWFDEQNTNGTPVIIYASMTTPETTISNEPLQKIGAYADSLSAAQAGVEIATVKGSNTIDVSTQVKPSEIYIKWKG